jgi:hypothetical protein
MNQDDLVIPTDRFIAAYLANPLHVDRCIGCGDKPYESMFKPWQNTKTWGSRLTKRFSFFYPESECNAEF